MNNLICFGKGYVASYLIDILNEYNIISTKRNLCDQSQNIISWDKFKNISEDTTHILISIPPVENKDIVYDKFYEQIRNLKNLKWLGYLSTTSVYGNHNGDIVDENSACNPTNERSKIRLKIEKQWLDIYQKYNIPVTIFRLSGIYGPGRNQIDRLKRGEELQNIYSKDKYFSRIHVVDIAQILKASMNNSKAGEIYNLADDYPCPSYEIVEYAYKLTDKKAPKRINLSEANLSPMMQEFYQDNKKISNDKIKRLLDGNLIFPNYKEGLKNI